MLGLSKTYGSKHLHSKQINILFKAQVATLRQNSSSRSMSHELPKKKICIIKWTRLGQVNCLYGVPLKLGT